MGNKVRVKGEKRVRVKGGKKGVRIKGGKMARVQG